MGAIVSLAIIISAFYYLDLIFSNKTKGFYIRSFIYLMTSIIPKVIEFLDNNSSHSGWSDLFYPVFAITLFALTLFTYFILFKPLIKFYYNNTSDNYKKLTFFDFIFSGYLKFKENIDNDIRKYAENIRNEESSILAVLHNLREFLPDFITDIYSYAAEEDEEEESTQLKLKSFIYFVMDSFVFKFFSESNARFTFRKLNTQTNMMETFITTREDKIPSPIPRNRKNMITASLKSDSPVIYSRNKRNHYCTKANSIKKKIYDDYVTFCLLSDDETKTPLISVNLDVKGTQAIRRMHSLVDSSIFTIVCNCITLKVYDFLDQYSLEDL